MTSTEKKDVYLIENIPDAAPQEDQANEDQGIVGEIFNNAHML